MTRYGRRSVRLTLPFSSRWQASAATSPKFASSGSAGYFGSWVRAMNSLPETLTQGAGPSDHREEPADRICEWPVAVLVALMWGDERQDCYSEPYGTRQPQGRSLSGLYS